MAVVHESACHGGYRADDNFSVVVVRPRARIEIVYKFRQGCTFDGGAVVKGTCYATRRDLWQSGCKGDDVMVILNKPQWGGFRSSSRS